MSVQSISQLLDKCLSLLNPICFSSSAQLGFEQPCFEEASQVRWELVAFLTSKKQPYPFSLPRIPKSEIQCNKGLQCGSHSPGNRNRSSIPKGYSTGEVWLSFGHISGILQALWNGGRRTLLVYQSLHWLLFPSFPLLLILAFAET